jgi:hypothetical protein
LLKGYSAKQVLFGDAPHRLLGLKRNGRSERGSGVILWKRVNGCLRVPPPK